MTPFSPHVTPLVRTAKHDHTPGLSPSPPQQDLTPAQRHVYLLRGPEPQTGRSTDGSIVPAPVQRRGEEEGGVRWGSSVLQTNQLEKP